MPTLVLKLFAGQGTGRTDGQSGDYMLPLFYLKIFCLIRLLKYLTS